MCAADDLWDELDLLHLNIEMTRGDWIKAIAPALQKYHAMCLPSPWAVENPSWPGGMWDCIYNESRDVYEIKSDLGQKIGEIGPTMVAFAIVRTNNFYKGKPEPPK